MSEFPAHVRPVDGASAAIIGCSPVMVELFRQLDRVGPSDVTVLIAGQSGTGKELVARTLHASSGRRGGPFVALNCAAVPASLQESELFGHEKGSFTGAASRRIGRFEQAHGGTLFLDEVAELSPALQAVMLRVLQERQFYRVGGSELVRTDVRILAATHRDLRQHVKAGLFREDLYYRLAVLELTVPPLADRQGDVELLAQHFLERFVRKHQSAPLRFTHEAIRRLEAYHWPGNVRELENAVERAVVLARDGLIRVEDLPGPVRRDSAGSWTPRPAPVSMREVERDAIREALRRTHGNVSEAGRLLGIPRTTLYRRLRELGIRR